MSDTAQESSDHPHLLVGSSVQASFAHDVLVLNQHLPQRHALHFRKPAQSVSRCYLNAHVRMHEQLHQLPEYPAPVLRP
jgi:hypothetical protein